MKLGIAALIYALLRPSRRLNMSSAVKRRSLRPHVPTNVREEPKASVLSAYKICDLAYKILKV
jgi:hypothetical protein